MTIATRADAARRNDLDRAVTSVLEQRGVECRAIVVVNGGRSDAAVLGRLAARPGVTVVQLSHGDLASARVVGVEQVEEDAFCFLDDDDELLPHSVASRLRRLLEQPAVDIVLGNGVRRGRMGDVRRWTPTPARAAELEADPLGGLLTANWMGSCSGLFRRASFAPSFFADTTAYEWTYWAFRVALFRTPAFLPEDTFVVHDTPESMSKSSRFLHARLELLEKLLPLGRYDRRVIEYVRSNRASAYHELAEHYRARQRRDRAWHFHLRTLRAPRGYRHLSFTRHLLFGSGQRRPG
ncbi:MAG TPA: glycosyltransferase [Gemmatimonadaceae bacterium]|nr:glycosyltransferase [Gemmatimonadaceae bacterium]